jgi:uncharacterized membrane protein
MLPNLAVYHPQVVHFAVALVFVGVLFRLVSLTGRLNFTNAAATALIVLGTGAAVVAVQSGTDAHGPVERIPGARDAVVDHEEWGERARNIFLVVAALELIQLAFRNDKRARMVQMASALVGLAGAGAMYEAAEHGGALVYNYGGGPGLRRGNPEDVKRLLLAGLYNSAQSERQAGRHDEAAQLTDVMASHFPSDPTVKILAAESKLRDRHDAAGTLAAIDSLTAGAAPDPRFRTRIAFLRTDALVANGMTDSARAVLTALQKDMPNNARIKAKLDSLK